MFPDSISSLRGSGESIEGFEIMQKAWCDVDVYYNSFRSSIKFEGHMGWKICDLNPILVRLLGLSQLSNPSDLLILTKYLLSCTKLRTGSLYHFYIILIFKVEINDLCILSLFWYHLIHPPHEVKDVFPVYTTRAVAFVDGSYSNTQYWFTWLYFLLV